MLSDIQAQRLPEKDKERYEKEYAALLAVFTRFMDSGEDAENDLEVIEELMDLRAKHLLGHALDGFKMTYEEAVELLRDKSNLSDLDRQRRDIVLAAIDNLVDFAVAEEYQMLSDIDEGWLDDDGGGDDEENEDPDFDPFVFFVKYNKVYGWVENEDSEYAMIVALKLLSVAPTTTLMYMTQGDERVRPWHLQWEGYTAPKSSFPAWLIPPIEHMCRCFLVEDTATASLPANVVAAKRSGKVEMPDWFNPTFKESVALGGRIFSDEHPYFQINPKHLSKLSLIASRIKERYKNGGS